MTTTLEQATVIEESRALDAAAIAFTAAVLLHNADHLRRGPDATPGDVFWLGSAAIVLEVAIVALVYLRHRYAPLVAATGGATLAAGYVFVHFTPGRSWLSDSLLGGAAPLSIAAALVEVAAALALAAAGVGLVLANRGRNHGVAGRPKKALAPVVAAMAIGNLVIFSLSLVAR